MIKKFMRFIRKLFDIHSPSKEWTDIPRTKEPIAKPCPNCEPDEIVYPEVTSNIMTGEVAVFCPNCGTITRFYWCAARAFDAWDNNVFADVPNWWEEYPWEE